jgi:predicted Zn-dependent protease
MRRLALLAVAVLAGGCAQLQATGLRSLQPRIEDLGGIVKAGAEVADAIQDARRELTPENEYYIGRSVAVQILARHDYRYLGRDAIHAGRLEGVAEYVNLVGAMVAAAAVETPRDDDRPLPLAGWRFVVLDSEEPNAFAAPGGYIFVTTGALRVARTEDELASVLAHEVAHVVRGHGLGLVQKARWGKVSASLVKAVSRATPEQLGSLVAAFDGVIDDIAEGLFTRGYSKDTEFEADRLGMEIVARAGYDPAAMVGFLQALQAEKGAVDPGRFGTHPRADERVARLEAHLATFGPERSIPAARTARFTAARRSLR